MASTRGQYSTVQREELVSFLEENRGTHVSVTDICSHFKKIGKPIGTTTVYRQLERLVDEGEVNKYIIDLNSPACFEYIGERGMSGSTCFHCKCEKCGKLIHLHCDDLEETQLHLLSEHGFRLDPKRTVLYGICAECAADSTTE